MFIHEIAREPRIDAAEKGIGTVMLRAMLEAVATRYGRGVDIVQLLVDRGNRRAIEWYRRRQFKAITRYETEDGEWKEGEIINAVPIYEPEEERGKRGRGPGSCSSTT